MRTLVKAVIGGALLLTMPGAAGWADGGGDGKNSVRWETIIGTFFIGAIPGTSANTVAGITGGGEPWSTLSGHAYVDLSSGAVDFEVKGLVLAGGNSIGTPATIAQVEGTLVCSPGTTSQAIINTPPVPLDAQGNASFNGSFTSPTDGCSPTAVVFLITIPSNGHWIANGAVRVP
jgi:hypothetical protein